MVGESFDPAKFDNLKNIYFMLLLKCFVYLQVFLRVFTIFKKLISCDALVLILKSTITIAVMQKI